jgi:predicted metal-dependent hydrolase
VSTANAYLTVGDIEVDVIYKDIKNLHIGVYPPMGRVRVAAPAHLDEERIRLAVIQRLAWIKRQRDRLQRAERQSEREMLTGESHYVWGRRFRLQVVEGNARPRVTVNGGRLTMEVPAGTGPDERRRLLQNWERQQLRKRLPHLITKWAEMVGCDVPAWGIRRMKTKWGTCGRTTGRLWFNLELAKKDPRCLEYIVAHEMTHLLERGHGERFVKLMDHFMPDWRSRRDELNSAPLSDERWAA